MQVPSLPLVGRDGVAFATPGWGSAVLQFVKQFFQDPV